MVFDGTLLLLLLLSANRRVPTRPRRRSRWGWAAAVVMSLIWCCYLWCTVSWHYDSYRSVINNAFTNYRHGLFWLSIRRLFYPQSFPPFLATSKIISVTVYGDQELVGNSFHMPPFYTHQSSFDAEQISDRHVLRLSRGKRMLQLKTDDDEVAWDLQTVTAITRSTKDSCSPAAYRCW